jgi:hypothetical protein
MYGGDFFTPVLPQRETFVPRADSPESLEALQWLEGTVSAKLHGGNFSGGTAAMRVSNSSEGNFVFGDNWDYAHIPTGPKGTKISRLSSTGWVMGANSKHKDEAWELMRFLFRADSISKFGFCAVRIITAICWCALATVLLEPGLAWLWTSSFEAASFSYVSSGVGGKPSTCRAFAGQEKNQGLAYALRRRVLGSSGTSSPANNGL